MKKWQGFLLAGWGIGVWALGNAAEAPRVNIDGGDLLVVYGMSMFTVGMMWIWSSK